MTEPTPNAGTSEDTPDNAPAASTPRWVKAFGITAGVVVVLFLAVHLAGGGHMGGH